MIMQQNYNNMRLHEGFTAEEVVSQVGISLPAFSKRMKSTNYSFALAEVHNPARTGRKIKLYKPDVISLWKQGEELKRLLEKFEIEAKRKMRADKGKRRNGDEQEWRFLIYATRDRYISNAQANLTSACEYAVKDYARTHQSTITASILYNYLRRKDYKDANGKRTEFYEEGWESIRQKAFKKSDDALIRDHKMRYNYLEMFENEGLCGAGFGALKVIVIDDFKRDSWSIGEDDKLSMPNGVAYMDGLTGMPLHVQVCKGITTNAIATGILAVVSKYGIHPDTVFVMENSKAMKNINITQLIRLLYTKEQLEAFDKGKHRWIKELFNYQTGPIIHNLPNLPTYPFKAAIERNFKIWKDEYDAVFHPLNFQGGNRNEATQLTLGAMPVLVGQDRKDMPLGTYTLQVDEYWQSFFEWVYSDFVNKPRPQRFKWWKNKTQINNQDVTIWNVFNYYLGADERQEYKPNMIQVAYLLYFANPELQKRPVKIRQLGGYQCTINNETFNISARELDETKVGLKVVTIPVPNAKNQFVVMDVTNSEEPCFVCFAKDYTARRISDVPRMRAEKSFIRKERNVRLSNNTLNVVNENYTDLRTIPESDEMIKGMLEESNRINYTSSLSGMPTEIDSSENVEPLALDVATAIESAEYSIEEDVPDFIKNLRNKFY